MASQIENQFYTRIDRVWTHTRTTSSPIPRDNYSVVNFQSCVFYKITVKNYRSSTYSHKWFAEYTK